jgi:hypothetical protein
MSYATAINKNDATMKDASTQTPKQEVVSPSETPDNKSTSLILTLLVGIPVYLYILILLFSQLGVFKTVINSTN